VEADGTRLENELAVFQSFEDRGRKRGGLHWGVTAPGAEAPSEELVDYYYRLAREGNATCFSRNEQAHPINFYEQSDVCEHCGAERFRTTKASLCCQGGRLRFNNEDCNRLPPRLLTLISSSPGLTKQSRCANDLFRFAQFALPKGTHRIPDSFQHLKVTGIPYAIVNNLNESSSTRSFLDDPCVTAPPKITLPIARIFACAQSPNHLITPCTGIRDSSTAISSTKTCDQAMPKSRRSMPCCAAPTRSSGS